MRVQKGKGHGSGSPENSQRRIVTPEGRTKPPAAAEKAADRAAGCANQLLFS
ncbi:hypothetical protein HMPREF9371_1550 [Neisseria shayeganii 871]|uniref:Uncharacterized protein n=1 Tax=Neisseria shayeganii 871 TaxID=1032488 RepID=G4CIW1_9NEIS|nr:hypothetical protein HMPREF9371_1550 [Neisseria shayeganii 871]